MSNALRIAYFWQHRKRSHSLESYPLGISKSIYFFFYISIAMHHSLACKSPVTLQWTKQSKCFCLFIIHWTQYLRVFVQRPIICTFPPLNHTPHKSMRYIRCWNTCMEFPSSTSECVLISSVFQPFICKAKGKGSCTGQRKDHFFEVAS